MWFLRDPDGRAREFRKVFITIGYITAQSLTNQIKNGNADGSEARGHSTFRQSQEGTSLDSVQMSWIR